MPELVVPPQPVSPIKPEWPLSRKLRVWTFQYLVPLLAYPLIRLLPATYRWRVCLPEEVVEMINNRRPFIVAVWHGDMVMIQAIAHYLGIQGRVAVMVGLSQAGEVEARILKLLGYEVVRGSEKKRGKKALEDMKQVLKQGAIAALTVDGPSGPRQIAKPGVVYLAKHCQAPIVPIGFITDREWKLPTWDKTRIPQPFARCIAVCAPAVQVPEELDESRFQSMSDAITRAIIEAGEKNIAWPEASSTDIIARRGK